MAKFDPSFFDEEFYRSTKIGPNGIGLKGAKRDSNSPFYVEYAWKVTKALADDPDCKTMLDIGGGVGYRSENHESEGRDVYTCDVSKWAADNSIRPDKHYHLDIRKLSTINRQFDLVNVERVIEYLPARESLKALKEVDAVASKYIFLAIICADHVDGEGITVRAAPGRLNINTKAYWDGLFAKMPWTLDQAKTDIMLEGGWDCIWCFRKNEVA